MKQHLRGGNTRKKRVYTRLYGFHLPFVLTGLLVLVFLNSTARADSLYKLTFTQSGIDFTQSGLYIPHQWSITLNDIGTHLSNSEISFEVPNGTYSYTVNNIRAYDPIPQTGTVTVMNADVKQAITFYPCFTIAVLPDIQNYTSQGMHVGCGGSFGDHLDEFHKQVDWIISTGRQEFNIVFVAQLGDLINACRCDEAAEYAYWPWDADWPDNWDAYYKFDQEWTNAEYLLKIPLSGIPFSVVGGNHDNGSATWGANGYNWMYFNKHFGPDNFSEIYDWYKGYCSIKNDFIGNENNWEEFKAFGQTFLILNIECDLHNLAYNEYDLVYQWANAVLRNHPNDKAIVITHGYIDADGRLTNDGDVSGPEVYNSIVANNQNVIMVLCGHIEGEKDQIQGRISGGNMIYACLQDYQEYDDTGDGYLRLFEFCPGLNKISAVTYSPSLGCYWDPFTNVDTYDYPTSVNQPPLIHLSSSPTTFSVPGQPVTFTAWVTKTAPGIPRGNVTFSDGGVFLGNAALGLGITVAAFTCSSLSAGVHTITATYNGDKNYQYEATTCTLTWVVRHKLILKRIGDFMKRIFPW